MPENRGKSNSNRERRGRRVITTENAENTEKLDSLFVLFVWLIPAILALTPRCRINAAGAPKMRIAGLIHPGLHFVYLVYFVVCKSESVSIRVHPWLNSFYTEFILLLRLAALSIAFEVTFSIVWISSR